MSNWELEESRDALHDLSEWDRYVSCGHSARQSGACPDCGDEGDCD